MPRLTPEELLRAIEASPDEHAVDEDMGRILSMTLKLGPRRSARRDVRS
jgi:hypothetical protein